MFLKKEKIGSFLEFLFIYQGEWQKLGIKGASRISPEGKKGALLFPKDRLL
jgi:hypothetical protein